MNVDILECNVGMSFEFRITVFLHSSFCPPFCPQRMFPRDMQDLPSIMGRGVGQQNRRMERVSQILPLPKKTRWGEGGGGIGKGLVKGGAHTFLR